MGSEKWQRRIQKMRGGGPIETDLTAYEAVLYQITEAGEGLRSRSDSDLQSAAKALREKARHIEELDDLLVDVFALTREVADRVLGMRPFDVQIVAGLVLNDCKLADMLTGEGKTLAAVLPACLNALTEQGVHILTFNDYLARRDAAWMGPVYEFMDLSVGTIQEGMEIGARREAYAADVTYATAKEAGFDFLRMHLCREPEDQVHRPFHYAIVDEADSILIDEARVPLVIAGELPKSDTSPIQIAGVVDALREGKEWETDENRRNVQLTGRGIDVVEERLACGDLHEESNYLLLTEINQALHARVLLQKDVDYIVREDRIELVDEFTGRVVDDRRWPDGLQAAVEAREGVPIQPGGHILGSIALQHFMKQYPRLCGMTATARPAADELVSFYGLKTVIIPPNKPCIREDLEDVVFTHEEAKYRAILAEIRKGYRRGRPVLVGTRSVKESEELAAKLGKDGISCSVLNAKNDEAEAEIIAGAGAVGAVTISTNMAGRGTDIRLGGTREEERDKVVQLGGLYVISTGRQESARVDDQLRGRSGRQGDPGASRIYLSLEDEMLVRFGIDTLIPLKLRSERMFTPVDHPVIRREIARLQRIVKNQNFEIRKTLTRYTTVVEEQRKILQEWRSVVLTGEMVLSACAERAPERYKEVVDVVGPDNLQRAERMITLHYIDECWAEYLSFVAHVREGIHLVSLGGKDPLAEFHKQIAEPFGNLHDDIEKRTVEKFETLEIQDGEIDLEGSGLKGPSSTWTYLINDRALTDLQQMLFGHGSSAISAGATLMIWPVLIAWAIERRFRKGKK